VNFSPQPFLIFAPMATVSHAGFRSLVEDWGGCALYFTEMIDATSHLSGRRYEAYYADASPCPAKVVYQIVGADEDALVAAAASLAARDCAGIDINMGCSAPHIFRHGAGISWMNDPAKAARLVERLRVAVGYKSLSMKLRIGETEDEGALVAFAQSLEGAGADFLTLHPRVRKGSLGRPSRWSWVKMLRDAVTIPVVGNGDLNRFDTLRSRWESTPADGWMVGRRAVTAPWTFAYWTGRWVDPTFDLAIDLEAVCRRFHELLEASQPPEFWVTRSRRFYSYFSQNIPFGHAWGARLQNRREYQVLTDEVFGYWKDHPEERHTTASSLEN
jgi:tRNA-dihydrouridine synthase B